MDLSNNTSSMYVLKTSTLSSAFPKKFLINLELVRIFPEVVAVTIKVINPFLCRVVKFCLTLFFKGFLAQKSTFRVENTSSSYQSVVRGIS